MLGGELAVLQAPMFDGLSLDPFAQFDDCRSPAEVGVGRRHVGQALVVSLVIVVLDEGLDVGFEVAGQEVVFQQDAVFPGSGASARSCPGFGDDTGRRGHGSSSGPRCIPPAHPRCSWGHYR